MIDSINEFGIDSQSVLEFSDIDLLCDVHKAIQEYRVNKNSHFDDITW